MRKKVTDAEFTVISDPRASPPADPETWNAGAAREYQTWNIWGRLAYWAVLIGGMSGVYWIARAIIYRD